MELIVIVVVVVLFLLKPSKNVSNRKNGGKLNEFEKYDLFNKIDKK